MRTKLLNDLLSIPTAPYREFQVIRFLENFFTKHQLHYYRDPVGNLILNARSETEYRRRLLKKDKEPLRLFISHLDHPGFHGTHWLSPKRLQVQWYGGSPKKKLNGTSVWIADDHSKTEIGTLQKTKLKKSGRAIDTAEVVFPTALMKSFPNPKKLYGAFAFRKPVWKSGSRLYTKAADDLVGVFSIISMALQFKNKNPNWIGLLSRAEEVGFLGTIAHLDHSRFKNRRREVLGVSLETSQQLPQAEIGKGPVLRIGDRSTVFSSTYFPALESLANRVIKKRFQKRIMDGGSCEGSATSIWGHPTIALSVPLGNYHNEGFEGGPDCRGALGPAPEFVDIRDVQTLLKITSAIAAHPLQPEKIAQRRKTALQKHFRLHQGPFQYP